MNLLYQGSGKGLMDVERWVDVWVEAYNLD